MDISVSGTTSTLTPPTGDKHVPPSAGQVASAITAAKGKLPAYRNRSIY